MFILSKVGVPNPFERFEHFGNPAVGSNNVEAIPAPQMGGIDAISAAGAPLAADVKRTILGSFESGLVPLPSRR